MKKIFLLLVCIFAASAASAQGFANETVNGGQKARNHSSSSVEFQAYANVGTIFTGKPLLRYHEYHYEKFSLYNQVVGPTVDFSAGIMIKDGFYIGAEIGAQLLFESTTTVLEEYYYGKWEYTSSDESTTGVCIPVGVNLKGYILKNRTINPFINASVGYNIVVGDLYYDNSLYCQVGAGIEWKRLSLGIGYNILYDVWGEDIIHAGYVKLGVRIGK